MDAQIGIGIGGSLVGQDDDLADASSRGELFPGLRDLGQGKGALTAAADTFTSTCWDFGGSLPADWSNWPPG